MVPLKEAIEDGLWLRAECAEDEGKKINIKFQIKILSCKKIDIAKEVDNLFELKTIDTDSNVWLLKAEVVNLLKTDLSVSGVTGSLILVDEERFNFSSVQNRHLNCFSKYADSSGLSNFFGTYLSPKIKKKGSIAFELPEFFDELFVGVKYGTVVAV